MAWPPLLDGGQKCTTALGLLGLVVLSDVSQDTCLVPRMAKAARCRWWARGALSACEVCSGGVCVAGRKREAGDAIVETRVGAAQARVGFVSFVRWIAPIAKKIAQMALELSNSKNSKTLLKL